MSTGPTDDESVPTMVCRVCQVDVPAGKFCGLCGAVSTPRRGNGPDWLRLNVFGAAPNERVWSPSIASALFPHLPSQSRGPFRIVLMLVVMALVSCAMLRMPSALISVGVLGLPLLYLLYLHESDAHRDFPPGTLLLTVALGVGLGFGWVLLTGAVIARTYDLPLGTGIVTQQMLRDGIGLSLGAVLLMLVPGIAVRLLRPGSREALDGATIAALGALCFTAAATMTRLAPQIDTGTITRRPMESLLVEAGIRGVAVPLTAAAVGGLIGAALWFSMPKHKVGERHGRKVRLMLVGFAAATMAVYLGIGVIDMARFPQLLLLTMHLGMAMAALLLLRLGLQLALLHEEHDAIHAHEPLLCPYCGMVVPDMAFCPSCGVATRATSRTSRRQRRQDRPIRVAPRSDSP